MTRKTTICCDLCGKESENKNDWSCLLYGINNKCLDICGHCTMLIRGMEKQHDKQSETNS